MQNRTTTTYDADDEVVQSVDPMGRTTTATFSDRGWVPTVTDPLNFTSTYSYSPVGQTLSAVQKGTSGGEIETYSYGYNADQELTSVSDPLTELTSYSYDGVGNLVATTDPTYDADNEMTGASDSFATLTFTYDADGDVQTAGTAGPGTGQPSVLLSYYLRCGGRSRPRSPTTSRVPASRRTATTSLSA